MPIDTHRYRTEFPDRTAETQNRRDSERARCCFALCASLPPHPLLIRVGLLGNVSIVIALSPLAPAPIGRGGAVRSPFSRVVGEGQGMGAGSGRCHHYRKLYREGFFHLSGGLPYAFAAWYMVRKNRTTSRKCCALTNHHPPRHHRHRHH